MSKWVRSLLIFVGLAILVAFGAAWLFSPAIAAWTVADWIVGVIGSVIFFMLGLSMIYGGITG